MPWRDLAACVRSASLPARSVRIACNCRYDSGTIGQMWKTQRPPVLLFGFGTSGPEGRSIAVFGDWLPHGDTATGPATADDLLRKLSGRKGVEPYSMPRRELTKRVAVIQVDGAHTVGGPESVHRRNPASAELILKDLGLREDWAAWDEFHKLDVASRNAFNSVPMAKEFFDVVREVSYKYACGQGIQMDRSVSAALDLPHLVTKNCAGTRKIVCLAIGAGSRQPCLQCLQFGISLGFLRGSWRSSRRITLDCF